MMGENPCNSESSRTHRFAEESKRPKSVSHVPHMGPHTWFAEEESRSSKVSLIQSGHPTHPSRFLGPKGLKTTFLKVFGPEGPKNNIFFAFGPEGQSVMCGQSIGAHMGRGGGEKSAQTVTSGQFGG